ncbi:MAG TPA: helix-hairpin-helix domain-containing protein [Candidatus Deferrimicrobiaceae bacterium]|jgi:DNA uptake protein ComE-like DNA-binding protein|nr:helix-hairpin-helix domain-containing protein [Candidatus Deferrimicrobiaceae bacterium]
MKSLNSLILPVLLLTALSYAQQGQQAAPPPTDQSSYPSETHKMTAAEKSDTPSANGQPVDLNSASKKDLAALPGVGPDHAQSIIDARPFGSKEDLLKKKVISQATYDKIQNRITANGPKKQSLPEGPQH